MIIIELNENKDLYSLLYKSLNENNCLLSYNKQKKQKKCLMNRITHCEI